jgi:hypothetical protein
LKGGEGLVEVVPQPTGWLCIEIGGSIFLTDAPENIRFRNKVFHANNWAATTNREMNGQDSLPSFNISGLMVDAGITVHTLDILSNNRTDVLVWMVDTQNGFDFDGEIIWTGVVGSIDYQDWGKYEIEIVAGGHASDVTLGISHTVTCNRRFGDIVCAFNPPQYPALVLPGSNTSVIFIEGAAIGTITQAEVLLKAGYLKFTGTEGVVGMVQSVFITGPQDALVFLSRPLLFIPQVNDPVVLVPGCDRTKTSCLLWDNTINFLGPAFDAPTTAKRLSAT